MLHTSPTRRVAVLLSLVLYGTVALMGQGLHVLMPHAGECCATAETASKHVGCTCQHHSHCGEKDGSDSEDSQQKPSHDCNNCSICEFLAQASAASWAYVPTISQPQITSRVVVHPTPAFSSSESLVHVPRGPPSVAI